MFSPILPFPLLSVLKGIKSPNRPLRDQGKHEVHTRELMDTEGEIAGESMLRTLMEC